MPKPRQTIAELRNELAEAAERLARRAKAELGAERVIMHGSLARGEIHRHSDIDLVVIWDTDLHFFDRIGRVLDLAPDDLPVEPMVYTPAEWGRMAGGPFRELVERDAVELAADGAATEPVGPA